MSVLEHLVKVGIPRSRLSAKGRGEQAPRSDKKTERGYYENRRVEFIITRENKLAPKVAPPAPPQPVGQDGPPPPDTPIQSPDAPKTDTPPAPPAPAPKGGQP